MLVPEMLLAKELFTKMPVPEAPTRDGFGYGIVEAGKSDERIVVLCADLAESTRAQWFKDAYPERYIEMGVAEQNLVTVASGMANYGKRPFITSYAAFSPGRNWEQIRTTVALAQMPVVVCGMHAGISVGPDGATHQPLEDVALMRVMPNMTVIVPCDALEAKKATLALAAQEKPAYIRLGRSNVATVTTENSPFILGKISVLWKSPEPQVALVANGSLVYEALLAAHTLEKEGISCVVINVHTVKPLDEKGLLQETLGVRKIVVAEEHQVAGGLGGALCELFSEQRPTRIMRIGVKDQYGQSGTPDELMDFYALRAKDIVAAAR
jgi:transketolase